MERKQFQPAQQLSKFQNLLISGEAGLFPAAGRNLISGKLSGNKLYGRWEGSCCLYVYCTVLCIIKQIIFEISLEKTFIESHNLANFSAMSEIMPLTAGSAPSTVTGKNAALAKFNGMQRLREQPEFADLSEDEVCSVELFQIFARYVTETATTGEKSKSKEKKEKLLMRDTCTQYVSGMKNLAFARFPKNEIWSTERLWYTKLRSVIAAAVNRRQILLGLAVQEKSDAVDRTLLTLIMQSMMKVRKLG